VSIVPWQKTKSEVGESFMQRSQRLSIPFTRLVVPALAVALGLTVATDHALADAPLASGKITTTATGASNTYALTLSDSASSTTPIGSVWAAWIPGQFYFTTTPTSVSEPTGWSGTTSNGGIQWTANSAAFDVTPGNTLAGFGFQSAESPALIDGNSPSFPGTPTMTSVAYEGGLFSDGGTTFAFTPTAVPEPTTLVLLTPTALMLLRRRKQKAAL
jgi:hypothetical protein